MFSFYIYKNSTFSPNILLLSTIDEMNEKIIDSLIEDIISSLLENNYISLNDYQSKEEVLKLKFLNEEKLFEKLKEMQTRF